MRIVAKVLAVGLMLVLPSLVSATWNPIHKFDDPALCGYFFDANHGLIGTGSPILQAGNQISIFQTTDGGITWIPCQVPGPYYGGVTDIFMQNALVGYASIYSNSSVLWMTTDGGLTWSDVGSNGTNSATCVYATTHAIVITDWNTGGGISLDGGMNFDNTFAQPAGTSNGIDFSDDLHGVVTTRPGGGNYNYFTTDGGITWQNSGFVPESWGVYGVKGTATFLSAAEGQQQPFGGSSQHSIFVSRDNGVNWNTVYVFPNGINFTGHIAGKANAVYIQTQTIQGSGLYRSDDFGTTWKWVQGPSNGRDTRFVVTGCAGEVVYAFDNTGKVQKTTDGGDGTLVASNPDPAPAISSIPSTRAGDTVLIPISLEQAGNPFSMTTVSFHLDFNEDVLTPVGLVTNNTLSQNASITKLDTAGEKGATCEITLPTPITEASNLALPLIYIQAFVTLSDSLETSVTLDSFAVNGLIPLSICSSPSQVFQIQRECGDSLISIAMRGVSLDSLVSIIPNPAHQNTVKITYLLSADSPVDLEILNASGIQVALPLSQEPKTLGLHTQEVETAGWPSGTYFVLLRTASGASPLKKLLQIR